MRCASDWNSSARRPCDGSGRFDFIHTLDGIRALIAAANSQHCVGIKLDAFHWYTSGAGLLDIEKLSPEEVVYVEINDGLKGDYDRFTLPEFQRELPGPPERSI
jgi:sugar phosphate isomerase/epimerase